MSGIGRARWGTEEFEPTDDVNTLTALEYWLAEAVAEPLPETKEGHG